MSPPVPVPSPGPHITFTPIDVVAVLLGVVCALIVCWRKRSLDAETFLSGFAPGTSTTYFASMALFMWFPQNPLYDEIVHSNVVLLCGAFILGVVMNVKTVYNLK
jgi:hypothetical protein